MERRPDAVGPLAGAIDEAHRAAARPKRKGETLREQFARMTSQQRAEFEADLAPAVGALNQLVSDWQAMVAHTFSNLQLDRRALASWNYR
jgi:hypothetical protein